MYLPLSATDTEPMRKWKTKKNSESATNEKLEIKTKNFHIFIFKKPWFWACRALI